MKKLVSWVEIPSKNFDRAVNFYKTVFKIDLQELSSETEKMACFPGGDGAIIYSSGFLPCSGGLVVSLNVPDNMKKTISRVKDNGGEIIKEKTKIQRKEGGFFALFIDSEGNRVGLYSRN